MPIGAGRQTGGPATSCSRLRERSIRIEILVRCSSPTPLPALTQPSLPLGRSVLVTPSQPPFVAATVSVAGEPNCVVAPTVASALPPGLERRGTRRWTLRTRYEGTAGACLVG